MTRNDPVISNRQALRDFYIEKSFEAGLQLLGNEVKSLRAGKANLKGSFAKIEGREVVLFNLHISPYEFSREDHDPLRPKKLLLNKSEIKHLEIKVNQRGYALIPLKIYFKRGYAKVELALAKGKRLYDKRVVLKEQQVKREIQKELRRRR